VTTAVPSRRIAAWALVSLAVGSFGIGMTEFVIMGLLPEIARDLLPGVWASSRDDAIAQAGWLISLYALGVVVGAPTISGLVARFPRNRVIVGLAAALTLFTVLTVIAPTFELVALSRFFAGLPHGAFFGMGALIAADVLGPGKRAKGVAIVLMGLTVANVVGVPVGTFLGQASGWRLAFLVVAAIFAAATVMVWIFVPAHEGDTGRTFRAELGVFRIGQVWLTLAMGAIGFGGFFAVYSYVSPLVTEISGSPVWVVPIVLVVMGIGMTVGNLLGGVLADRNLRATVIGGLAALLVVQALLAVTATHIVPLTIFVFLVGVASSVTSPAIQTRLMDVAGDNQAIAAALNHSALNIGNSLGAALGGVVIALGWGFVMPSWVGAALAALGVGIAVLAFALESRSTAKTRPLLSATSSDGTVLR
jgi:DHA1 family inner membrane transport protein